MEICSYSRGIDAVLLSPAQGSEKVVMLFDQFSMLASNYERDEFVAALIHHAVTAHTRRANAFSFSTTETVSQFASASSA
jgi:hypothetical protein